MDVYFLDQHTCNSSDFEGVGYVCMSVQVK